MAPRNALFVNQQCVRHGLSTLVLARADPGAYIPLFTSPLITGVAQKAAFFVLTENIPHHTGFDARLADIILPRIAAMGYELVRVRVLGRERPTVQIMADRADGSQITVEDCEAISHQIGAVLDVEDIVPGAWTLEVSSAGIDRPLTRGKDWNRFAGHLAKVEMSIPTLEGRKRFSGTVLGSENGQGRLKLEDGSEVAVTLTDVKAARLILTDALIAATAGQTPEPDEMN